MTCPDYDVDYADHHPSNATCPHCGTALQITLPAHLSVVVSPGKSQLEIARERFPRWTFVEDDAGRLEAELIYSPDNRTRHIFSRYQYNHTLPEFFEILERDERTAGLEQ